MLVDEISTKVKRCAIILTIETVGFLAHMGYNKLISFRSKPIFLYWTATKVTCFLIFPNNVSTFFTNKKTLAYARVIIRLAGAAGIEPASTVLETDALPLNQAPISSTCL